MDDDNFQIDDIDEDLFGEETPDPPAPPAQTEAPLDYSKFSDNEILELGDRVIGGEDLAGLSPSLREALEYTALARSAQQQGQARQAEAAKVSVNDLTDEELAIAEEHLRTGMPVPAAHGERLRAFVQQQGAAREAWEVENGF